MNDAVRSWFKDNHTLVIFLIGQALAIGAASAGIIAYMVRLETRVHILETRGAPYTAEKLGQIDDRLTKIEQQQLANKISLDRIVEIMTRELRK